MSENHPVPFLDVNERTGRLAGNIPLLKNRLAPLSLDLRSKLAERVAEIVAALNDANHIACGISKRLFGGYQPLPIPEVPDERITGDFPGPGF